MLLIDPKKLKAHYSWWGNEDMQRTLFDDIVDEQPLIDAEPVVRCVNCVHDGKRSCPLFVPGATSKDFFCASGKPKEVS